MFRREADRAIRALAYSAGLARLAGQDVAPESDLSRRAREVHDWASARAFEQLWESVGGDFTSDLGDGELDAMWGDSQRHREIASRAPSVNDLVSSAGEIADAVLALETKPPEGERAPCRLLRAARQRFSDACKGLSKP